jgi:hypothetical protein
MASKAFQQICKFLDDKGFKYATDGEGSEAEKILFGAKGDLVQQTFLFIVETDANVVQFRSVRILDENDLKNYHGKPENRVKLYEYLLKKNYEWKFGKFALDPEDEKVDLYFIISDYVDAEKGIEKDLLDIMDTMLFAPSFVPNRVEQAIKDIKSILATGETSKDEYESGDLMQTIAQMASDPEMVKQIMANPDAPYELKRMLSKMLGEAAESPEILARKASTDGIGDGI